MDDLIHRARASLSGQRRPREVYLRRAVSDSYYALFHCLAAMCADELIGVTKRGSADWRRVYRGLEHSRAKDEFRRNDLAQVDPIAPRIAATFIQLQDARHLADYDPASTLRRRDGARVFIEAAELAIANLKSLSADARRGLATRLLIRVRN